MKRILSIALAFVVCSFITVSAAPKKPKAETKTVVYATTLHCDKCAKKISENVSFEKGVKDLKIDVPSKQVTVVFDTAKTDTLTLRKAINKLGYEAKVVSLN